MLPILLTLQAAAPPRPLAPLAFDYPPAAIRENARGEAGFALAIDAAGAVTGCRIVASSGSATLDEATCRQAARRRFEPARDAAGTAVAGSYAGRARYGVAGFAVIVAYAVDAEGRVVDCTIAQTSGRPDLDESACRLLVEKARFTPKRGADGAPVRVEGLTRRITFAADE